MIFHFTPEQREQLRSIEQEQREDNSLELFKALERNAAGPNDRNKDAIPDISNKADRKRVREAKFNQLLQQYEFQQFEQIREMTPSQQETAFYNLADEHIIAAYIFTMQREQRGELNRTVATGTDPDGNRYRRSNKGYIISQDGDIFTGPNANGKYYQVIITDEVLSREVNLPEISWEPVLELYDLSSADLTQDIFCWDLLPEIEDLQRRTKYRETTTFNGDNQREYYLTSSVMDGEEMDRQDYMTFNETGVFNYLKDNALRDYFTAYKDDPQKLEVLSFAIRKAIYDSPFVLSRYNPEFEPDELGIGDPGIPEPTEEPPLIRTVNINKSVVYPLDKVTQKIHNLPANIIDHLNRGEQLTLDLFPEQEKLNATATYSIDFDKLPGVTISRQLNIIDKQIQIAAAALYDTGAEYISIQNIYEQMRYPGPAGGEDYKKIKQAVLKMMRASIHLDNENESKAFGASKRPKFEYDGQLFPAEMVTATINGKITKSAIHMFREPPLITFAKSRNQITTIPADLQAIPVNRNERNSLIDDYLKIQISHMKNPKGKKKISNRMLFETIFKYIGITERKAKERSKTTIFKLLDFYKQKEFIKGYKKDKDGVTIIF